MFLCTMRYKRTLEASGTPFPKQPARAFVTLDAEETQQAALDWVTANGKVLEKYLALFRKDTGSDLDFAAFNQRFLQQQANNYAVFVLSHAVGRLKNLFETDDRLLEGEFPGQLFVEIIFRLLQVIETTIHERSGHAGFMRQIAYLAKVKGLSVTETDLREINSSALKGFDQTILGLFKGTAVTASGKISKESAEILRLLMHFGTELLMILDQFDSHTL